jgi:Xaa-Pro aminopeptidase
MIVSNEPGIYRTGKWGIRIENLLAVRRRGESELGRFLEFETLTLCPLDRRMIDASLLSGEERRWIDGYHRRVREELAPLLDDKDAAWLIDATKEMIE